jgi:hypothetical protein
VTYVDTIALAVIIIGSILTLALIMLSVKWWKLIVTYKANKSRQSRQERQQSEASKKPTSNHLIKSKSQTLVQLKETAGWNKLINKRVKTCEMVDIGRVSDINDQFMTVIHSATQREYIIPTYYIREYDQEKVLIDTSIRYLLTTREKENYNLTKLASDPMWTQ